MNAADILKIARAAAERAHRRRDYDPTVAELADCVVALAELVRQAEPVALPVVVVESKPLQLNATPEHAAVTGAELQTTV